MSTGNIIRLGLPRRISLCISTVTLAAYLAGSAGHAQTAAPAGITVHAKKFEFVPAAITVRKGELAKVILVSDDVPHGLAVPELNLHLDASRGHPGEAEFTPAKAGDFKGKCSRFCGVGHGRMRFTVHVIE